LNMTMSMHINDLLIRGRKWQMENFYKKFMEYLKIDRLGHWRVCLVVFLEPQGLRFNSSIP